MKTLQKFLRVATNAERELVASEAGTSVAYLYQLAGGHRKNPGAALAAGIERSTRALHKANPSRIPVVTVMTLVKEGEAQ